jgi:hypothetical protein
MLKWLLPAALHNCVLSGVDDDISPSRELQVTADCMSALSSDCLITNAAAVAAAAVAGVSV